MRLLAVWALGAAVCVALAAAIYHYVPPYYGLLYLSPGFAIWASNGDGIVHRNAFVILVSGAVWSILLLPLFVFVQRAISSRVRRGSLAAQAKREWTAAPPTLGPAERRDWAVVTIGLRWLVAALLAGLASLAVYGSEVPRAFATALLVVACGCAVVGIGYALFAKRQQP